jgi:hypothetical protein
MKKWILYAAGMLVIFPAVGSLICVEAFSCLGQWHSVAMSLAVAAVTWPVAIVCLSRSIRLQPAPPARSRHIAIGIAALWTLLVVSFFASIRWNTSQQEIAVLPMDIKFDKERLGRADPVEFPQLESNLSAIETRINLLGIWVPRSKKTALRQQLNEARDQLDRERSEARKLMRFERTID